MECFECKKELKGGFGVGPKPYIYFRCANCVIESVDQSTMIHGFQQIIEKTSGIVKPSNGYKAKFEALLADMNTINVIASYYVERAIKDHTEK